MQTDRFFPELNTYKFPFEHFNKFRTYYSQALHQLGITHMCVYLHRSTNIQVRRHKEREWREKYQRNTAVQIKEAKKMREKFQFNYILIIWFRLSLFIERHRFFFVYLTPKPFLINFAAIFLTHSHACISRLCIYYKFHFF